MTDHALPNLVLLTVLVYGLVGVVFSVAFMLVGAAVIDPIIRSTPWRTRALFAPGAVALWPVLAIKWLRTRGTA